MVIAIVRCERPWKLPWNTITLGLPVACLASLTAASVASAPELAKKNCSMPGGVIPASRAAEWFEAVVAVAVDLGVQEPAGLLAHRLDDRRVAVAGVDHADARGQVEVVHAVGGGDRRTRAGGDLQVGQLEPDVGEVGVHQAVQPPSGRSNQTWTCPVPVAFS